MKAIADYTMTNQERSYLRDLAKKQIAYSSLPVMEYRKKEWLRHNSGKYGKPLVLLDMAQTRREEIVGPLKCESRFAREIELQILYNIGICDHIGDDRVVPDYYLLPLNIQVKDSLTAKKVFANNSEGEKSGYHWDPPIKDLKKDMGKLKPHQFSFNFEVLQTKKEAVENILGDIMPVVLKNRGDLFVSLLGKALHLMGMENMYMAMYDYPEEFHQLMRYITDSFISKMRWQEAEGYLSLNTGNDYAGAGSLGFTDELPNVESKQTGKVMMKDIWLNLNAQEAVGLSPEMYEEFAAPYYYEVAGNFGLVYYGCCEPVEKIWHSCISKMPKLRKVSISAWCDEEFMGEALRGSKIVYCRKPSPNYITNTGPLYEEAYAEHIRKTLSAAKGCPLEICMRDIITFGGNPKKLWQAVSIIRREIDRLF